MDREIQLSSITQSKSPRRLPSKYSAYVKRSCYKSRGKVPPICQADRSRRGKMSSGDNGVTKSNHFIDLTNDSVVDLTESSDADNSSSLIVLSDTAGNSKGKGTSRNKMSRSVSSEDVAIVRTEVSPRVCMTALLTCPVCLEKAVEFQKGGRHVVSTKCGHLFCDLCIRQAIQDSQSCPTCRVKLKMKEFHRVFL